MRKPESVKKTETPRNPPDAQPNPAWKQNTAATASPRMPSSEARCWRAIEGAGRAVVATSLRVTGGHGTNEVERVVAAPPLGRASRCPQYLYPPLELAPIIRLTTVPSGRVPQ